MARLCLVAVALVGCNQVYDLHETKPEVENTDVDADGIEDVDDVCPGIADPDQIDADGDGVGDACDACPRMTGSVAPHDEDDDGIVDTCDNCPGFANRSQLDADGDDIGDGCDPSSSAQQRIFFDSFAPEPNSAWNPPWTADGDAVTPEMFPTESKLDGVRLIATGDRSWQIELGVRMTGDVATLGRVGVRLRNTVSGNYSECGVGVDMSMMTASREQLVYHLMHDALGVGFLGFTVSEPTVRVRATILINSADRVGFECSFDGLAHPRFVSMPLDHLRDVVVSLYADAIPEHVTYIDIVDTQ